MNLLRRFFSAGPAPSEYEVFAKLASVLQASQEIVQTLRSLPADKREMRFLDFLKQARLGAIVDSHDDEDAIVRALQTCFSQPEHRTWGAIAAELHDLSEAPADQVLRVLIRIFREERAVLRVFASGHDYWTCVFVPQTSIEDFDACIAGSSIVGYEEPHDPARA
jgi:hypothetical protein